LRNQELFFCPRLLTQSRVLSYFSAQRSCAVLRNQELFPHTECVVLHNEVVQYLRNQELLVISIHVVVLTLTNAICAEHMKMLEEGQLNNLKTLIYKMNKYFSKLNVLPFKFFAIDADNPELIQDDKKLIVFKDPSFVHSKVIEYRY